MVGRNICPECQQGKCLTNCDGKAWDFDADVPTICDCWMAAHKRGVTDEGE